MATTASADGGCIRILYSRNTRGTVIFGIQADGLARVTEWSLLDDLRDWNPVDYFILHPLVNEVWVETEESDDYSASHADTDATGLHTSGYDAASSSSSSSSGGTRSTRSVGISLGSVASADDAPNFALVLRRSELNYDVAHNCRRLQQAFYTDHHIPLPPASAFLHTLHGR